MHKIIAVNKLYQYEYFQRTRIVEIYCCFADLATLIRLERAGFIEPIDGLWKKKSNVQ